MHIKLFLAALFFFLPVFASSADVQVDIPKHERVYNKDHISCAWCAIEILARHAQERSLEGLSDKYQGMATDGNILWVLEHSGLDFHFHDRGRIDKKFIYDYLVIPCQYEKRGVAVGIDVKPHLSHLLNVVHYDIKSQKVCIIDNSDPKLEVREIDWHIFHSRLNGLAIVLYGKQDKFERYAIDWTKRD